MVGIYPGAKSRSSEGPSQRGYRKRQAALHSYIADAESIGADITRKITQHAHASQLARKSASYPADRMAIERDVYSFKGIKGSGTFKARAALSPVQPAVTRRALSSTVGKTQQKQQKIVILEKNMGSSRFSPSPQHHHIASTNEAGVNSRDWAPEKHRKEGKIRFGKENTMYHRRSIQLLAGGTNSLK